MIPTCFKVKQALVPFRTRINDIESKLTQFVQTIKRRIVKAMKTFGQSLWGTVENLQCNCTSFLKQCLFFEGFSFSTLRYHQMTFYR